MCLLSLGTQSVIFPSYAAAPAYAPPVAFAQGPGKFPFSKNVVFAFRARGLSEYICAESKLFSNIAVRTQCLSESFSYYSVKLFSIINRMLM